MTEIYILSFVLAFVLTVLLMPLAIRFSLNRGLIDSPDERKIHNQAIPRIGGVVFSPVALLTICVVVIVGQFIAPCGWICLDRSLVFQALAVLTIFSVGIVDDIKGLRYRIKFVAQFVAGILLCVSGAYINNLHGIFGLQEIPDALGWFITLFAVIYCTNAINFIDGVDGQASAIALTAMLYYAWLLHESLPVYSLACIAIAGALLAFMKFNIWGNPVKKSKTFMGDTGSLFLGLAIVMMGVLANNHTTTMSASTDTVFIMSFAPLFLPCMDVVRVVLHRVRMGLNPFSADKNHIHHKFLALGLSQHRVSFTVSMINVIVVAGSCLLAQLTDANTVILVILLVWTISNIIITRLIKEKIKK